MSNEQYKEILPLLEKISNSGKIYDVEKIKFAFTYAKEMHEGQIRLSGKKQAIDLLYETGKYILQAYNCYEI